jgi:hypothetical protein
MRVGVRGDAQLALTDEPADFRPGPSLPVTQTDPAVPQIVRAERRHGSGLAGASNRRSEPIGRGAGEKRCVWVAILPRRQRRLDRLSERVR